MAAACLLCAYCVSPVRLLLAFRVFGMRLLRVCYVSAAWRLCVCARVSCDCYVITASFLRVQGVAAVCLLPALHGRRPPLSAAPRRHRDFDGSCFDGPANFYRGIVRGAIIGYVVKVRQMATSAPPG